MCKCHWLSVSIAISVCVTICSIYRADVAVSSFVFSVLSLVWGLATGARGDRTGPLPALSIPLCSLSETVEVSGFCVVAFPNVVSPFLLLFFFPLYSLFSVPAIALLSCSLYRPLFLSEKKKRLLTSSKVYGAIFCH